MKNQFTERLEKIEKALEEAISLNIKENWKKDSFGKLPSGVKSEHIQNLVIPNKNLIDLGGKRWRPLLMILCYEMGKTESPALAFEESQVYNLTPLVEFVHTASLIHDDIEDCADLRRGQPAAHIKYGIDTALNAASWLYFEAPVCINKSNLDAETKLSLYELYTNELRKLHLGQAMDIYWHRTPEIIPTNEEYQAMVQNKTGTLASLAAQTGCIAGGMSKEKAAEYGMIAANIGIGFQIIDDVINLTTGNVGKKRGDDIVERKKSLPVIIHIQNCPEDEQKIIELMKQASEEGIDSPAVEQCISILEKSNCIKTAAEQGIKLIKENCALFNSDLINALFDKMIPESFK